MSKATSKAKAKVLVVGIYRRIPATGEVEYPARFSADVRGELVESITSGEGLGLKSSRVGRDGLVDQLMPTGRGRSRFANLPVLEVGQAAAIRAAVRDGLVLPDVAAHGMALPDDSLGRVLGAALDSGDVAVCERKAESVRLWIKQRCAPLGLLDGEDVTIIVVPKGTVTA